MHADIHAHLYFASTTILLLCFRSGQKRPRGQKTRNALWTAGSFRVTTYMAPPYDMHFIVSLSRVFADAKAKLQ